MTPTISAFRPALCAALLAAVCAPLSANEEVQAIREAKEALSLEALNVPWCGFYSEVDRTQPAPPHGKLGGAAVGNGSAFALQGLTVPLSTLHGIVGPDYDKPDGYFSDVTVNWEVDGKPAEILSDRLFRVRGAAVNITHERTKNLDLMTVTWAHLPERGFSWPELAAKKKPYGTLILRLLIARNRGQVAHRVAARVLSSGASPSAAEHGKPDTLRQQRGRRYLWLESESARLDHDRLCVEMGELEPRATGEVVLTVELQPEAAPGTPVKFTPPTNATRAHESLASTLAWWRSWSALGTQIECDDPWVADFIDTQRVVIKTQQSAQGATCPMSRYGSTWTRDITGPVFFFSRLGLFKDARAFLDYYYQVARRRGGIANASEAAADLSEPVSEPDWLSGGVFTGRNAAEGPSYIPLQYERYLRWSGDQGILEGRREFLLHTVLRQHIEEDGLMPFSGDETFRELLKPNFNLPMLTALEKRYFSANSSILYLQATEALWTLFPDLRDPATTHAQALVERYQRVKAALERCYRLEDGAYAALVHMDSRKAVEKPYEDVSFGFWWAAVREDPGRFDELNALAARLDAGERGFYTVPQRKPPSIFPGVDFSKGLLSGMTPGYALSALAKAMDPRAEQQFQAIKRFVSDTGTVSEVHLGADFSALHTIYDAVGDKVEFTARYRPWEGGIVGEAVLDYLSGWELGPLQGDGSQNVHWRPALPAGIDRLSIERLTLPGNTIGIAPRMLVTREQGALRVKIDLLPTDQGGDFDLWAPAADADALGDGFISPVEQVTGRRLHRIRGERHFQVSRFSRVELRGLEAVISLSRETRAAQSDQAPSPSEDQEY